MNMYGNNGVDRELEAIGSLITYIQDDLYNTFMKQGIPENDIRNILEYDLRDCFRNQLLELDRRYNGRIEASEINRYIDQHIGPRLLENYSNWIRNREQEERARFSRMNNGNNGIIGRNNNNGIIGNNRMTGVSYQGNVISNNRGYGDDFYRNTNSGGFGANGGDNNPLAGLDRLHREKSLNNTNDIQNRINSNNGSINNNNVLNNQQQNYSNNRNQNTNITFGSNTSSAPQPRKTTELGRELAKWNIKRIDANDPIIEAQLKTMEMDEDKVTTSKQIEVVKAVKYNNKGEQANTASLKLKKPFNTTEEAEELIIEKLTDDFSKSSYLVEAEVEKLVPIKVEQVNIQSTKQLIKEIVDNTTRYSLSKENIDKNSIIGLIKSNNKLFNRFDDKTKKFLISLFLSKVENLVKSYLVSESNLDQELELYSINDLLELFDTKNNSGVKAIQDKFELSSGDVYYDTMLSIIILNSFRDIFHDKCLVDVTDKETIGYTKGLVFNYKDYLTRDLLNSHSDLDIKTILGKISEKYVIMKTKEKCIISNMFNSPNIKPDNILVNETDNLGLFLLKQSVLAKLTDKNVNLDNIVKEISFIGTNYHKEIITPEYQVSTISGSLLYINKTDKPLLSKNINHNLNGDIIHRKYILEEAEKEK